MSIGTDHDTGAFAVASVRGWWRAEGRRIYPRVRSLLITADSGGSNGYRLRLWKLKLQEFADEASITIGCVTSTGDPVGRKVTDAEFATVRLYPHAFHGEWNYAIRPHTSL